MPSERRNTLRKSKGIHDLTLHECGVLVDALKDNVLSLQYFTTNDACRRLLASCDPIIYGKAPGPDPYCTHICHQFVDSYIDWNRHCHLMLYNTSPAPSRTHPGPSHHYITLHETSPMPYHLIPSHHHKLHMFVEVPLPPPSWRFFAAQQSATADNMMQQPPSPVSASRADTRELILAIVCLTQNSTMTDGTVNKFDKLVGLQEN
ncbi:uncharacterized protein HD556DRAFT_1441090 [Suillus plorans]|uniref:Uncharacterized protein n=1 Tax=Suillus plorans TaxID=116603 RepID=A0A9P7DK90_9AGAM|nr:uncharacterized protein HD556DRAFT_1441090 [Suillus plorans]KAG1796917.1 hypothetical protein HD556DRAFT_1441090 [Suillus plorans]